MKIGDASKVWSDGQHLRSFYLRQAIQASQLTMPILIPESDQWSPTTSYHQNQLPVLYQGLGGRGLYNLASKLLLTLYPPSQPMFRIQLSEAFLEQQLGGMPQAERQQMMRRLQRQTVLYERQILSQMEKLNVRAMLAELLMHLLCGGNTMAYIGNPRARFYPFRTFMWRMDSERNIRLAIIRERIYPEYLPPGVKPKGTKEPTAEQSGMDDQQEDIYTVIHINPKASTPAEQVQWHQEYDNKKVPDSDGASPINGSPWIMSRLYSAAGEPYCRNYFETSSLGDLASLEELQKGIVTGTLAGLKRLFRTSPNSYVLPRQVEEAMTGDCLEANEGDVGEIGDPGRWGASIQSLMPMMQMITDRVSKECLLTEAVQRDAERVTAEEIQTMVQELETSRAGLYSGMVNEVQLPIIQAVHKQLVRDGSVPDLPEDIADIQVLGGMDAIGRTNEVMRMQQFAQLGPALVGQMKYEAMIKPGTLEDLATGLSLDATKMVLSEQELEAERARAEAQQAQAMIAQQSMNGNGRNTSATAAPAAGP